MQSVELYNPNSPNLHVSSLASMYSLSEDLNPLNYQLTTDDFIALAQPDGQLLYTLDPSTSTSLFWALYRLVRYITRAASHDLYQDATIPFASKGYIPQIYFDRIGMQRPDILAIQEYHSINPLCGYTSRENLIAWYRDFQTIGRLTVQWIQTARRQTLQLGDGTGWNWEARHGPRLEYPNRLLITNDTSETEADFFSDTSSEGSESELGSWSAEGSGTGIAHVDNRVILHPTKSAYAARYPDFNPFAGLPLINNGYVDDNNNMCRAMIIHPAMGANQAGATIDYANALFTVQDAEE
ncbi:uncharacterized protein LACBIDRAFT_323269 [Laccaria bicolor S238N-H82]|uniref:Predicted protein n=1 Tax=Laccaria bicolor (strain S238N-H82 / ATCC MYA-4686) TaxID=486041 RepID=B0CZN8_LACBS|nr:uncharacterized protein LACBIDRAFT_323269 [Laccaria bicolor S238N-H82]EDR12183.1 predicted protein [Laccaria bicolor S238N-H82]|eukprot:XP_001876447.1 predicted protein [Laccaria bicolor S238N-H82]